MNRQRQRTYGTKKSASSAAAAAIFGTAAISPSDRQSEGSPSRAPLADITEALGNVNLNVRDDDGRDGGGDEEVGSNDNLLEDNLCGPQETLGTSIEASLLNVSERTTDALISLGPLIEVYQKDRNQLLSLQPWDEILLPTSTIQKIAEASYAEVYRITNGEGTSIIKIMRLKLSEQPESLEQWNAAKATDVISELRIMNALTEVPGFVLFKDAHLVQGRPPAAVVAACATFLEEKPNHPNFQPEFPAPETYPESAVFLAIELGDAGTVLDEIALQEIDMVWDVLLGIIITLSRAEMEYQFEHRDLHENNVCVTFSENLTSLPRPSGSQLKLGLSGIQITILDYGLSRATLSNGDKVFYDLENDLGLFRGHSNNSQFDTYRRMRTQLFTGNHKHFKRNWHNDESRSRNNGHTWEEYTPYTNVLWIRYILSWLVKNYKKSGGDENTLDDFNRDIRELQRRLNPRTWVENGAFVTAGQILEFAFQQGWVCEEQLASYGVESSILSQ